MVNVREGKLQEWKLCLESMTYRVTDEKDLARLKDIIDTIDTILNNRRCTLTDEQIQENIQASRERKKLAKIERMAKNREKALPLYDAAMGWVERTETNWLERPPTTGQEEGWKLSSLGEAYNNARSAARHLIDNCDLVQTRDMLNSINMRILETSNEKRAALAGTKAGEPNERYAVISRKHQLYWDVVSMVNARIKQFELNKELPVYGC